MIKVIALLSRKEGMTHEEFIDHWVNVHGPMGHDMPEVRRYVQSFVVDQPTRGDVPQLQLDGDVDGIAEVWYDDREAQKRHRASPEAKRWHADGAKFIGRIRSIVVEEKEIVPLRPRK
jgi:uncharacterized protein (TIGR02118 family)